MRSHPLGCVMSAAFIENLLPALSAEATHMRDVNLMSSYDTPEGVREAVIHGKIPEGQ